MSFPDFPGCVMAAGDLDVLCHHAAKAFALPSEGMIAAGEIIPGPGAIGTVEHDGPILPVEGPRPAPRSLRANVMLPEDVLRDIDRVGNNRRRLLAEAARAKLRVT